MRRHAHATPFARRKLQHKLEILPKTKRPKRIKDAAEILIPLASKENVDKILGASVSAACGCAIAMDRRAGEVAKFRLREKLRRTFKRVANCTTRASAELRRSLDAAIVPLVKVEIVDLETIESILDAAVKTFEKHGQEEPAKVALAVLTTAKVNFSGLSTEQWLECERAIKVLAHSEKTTTSSIVFAVLAAALGQSDCRAHPQSFDLIINCVREIANVWRRFNLRPASGRPPHNPSRFHRFCELILTEAIEPEVYRHYDDNELGRLSRLADAQYKKLRRQLQSDVGALARKFDRNWLVSHDHIIKALAC
jgi:hypothetical protein